MWHSLSASIDAGDAPLGRSSNVLGCIGRRLYSFGGENVPRVPVDGYVQVFDLDARAWTQVCPRGDEPAAHAVASGDTTVLIAPAGPWPCARVGAAAATCGGQLFVYGGASNDEPRCARAVIVCSIVAGSARLSVCALVRLVSVRHRSHRVQSRQYSGGFLVV